MRISICVKAALVCLCLSTSLVTAQIREATKDDGQWLFVDTADVPTVKQHLNHEAMFKKYVQGYNAAVLKAVDIVQSHAMDGGGYFTGISAKPTESPIGYQLYLFQKPLLDPPRTTSYCSGSSVRSVHRNPQPDLSRWRIPTLSGASRIAAYAGT